MEQAAANSAPLVDEELTGLVGRKVVDDSTPLARDAGYVIDAVLGQGAMGVALLAHVETSPGAAPRGGRPAAGTSVVIKVQRPGIVAKQPQLAVISFQKEVVALARLAERLPPCPFVVRYYDAGVWPVRVEGADDRVLSLPWTAVELVDGRPLGTTLEERLARAAGPLDPARAATLIDGLLRGVRAVHDEGLVHRDLKPGNVLVCGEPPSEIVKIGDFGVARAQGVGETFDVTVGTTGYAAPEQLEGRGPSGKDAVGPWSDVFALGAMIYEILAGRPMFDSHTALGFVGQVLARGAPRLSSLDLGPMYRADAGIALIAAFDDLILRATSPRSPGGGALSVDASMPMRPRDAAALLPLTSPLVESLRELGLRTIRLPRPRLAPLAARFDFSIGAPAPTPLHAAAAFADGRALAAHAHGLSFHDGERWLAVPGRATEDRAVAVLAADGGAFVVVRADGEVEVLPGGAGAFSLRLPFAVRAASAIVGDPRDAAALAVCAAHGEWQVVRLRGRTGMPMARFGRSAIHAMVLAPSAGDVSMVWALGARDDRHALVACIEGPGRMSSLSLPMAPPIHAAAVEPDGSILCATAGAVAHLDPRQGTFTLDASAPLVPHALVALADGTAWGALPGALISRRGGVWSVAHEASALASRRVLAMSASGAAVRAVLDDGRIVRGRMLSREGQ